MRHLPILATLLTGLVGCAQFPELEPFEPKPGVPVPALLPLEQLEAPPPREDDPVDAERIVARADALRDRAEAARPDPAAASLADRAAALRARASALADR